MLGRVAFHVSLILIRQKSYIETGGESTGPWDSKIAVLDFRPEGAEADPFYAVSVFARDTEPCKCAAIWTNDAKDSASIFLIM